MLLLHCWLPGHTTPHAPQLFSSKRASMQVLLQRVSPAAQTHAPLTQPLRAPVPHELPHAPQLRGSVDVLTHWFPQAVRPNGHWHVPAAQIRPGWHWLPQLPQFCWLACTSMHTPLQTARPAVQ